jgi:hypothetical protein
MSIESTAHHEAGHAVAAHVLGIEFTQATIRGDRRCAGAVEARIPGWVKRARAAHPGFRVWVDGFVMTHMAGFLAERDHTGRGNHKGAVTDYAATYSLAKMVTFNSRERDRYLDWLYERMRAMASRRAFRNAVRSVAAVLMRRQTVSARHVAVLTNRAIRHYEKRARR